MNTLGRVAIGVGALGALGLIAIGMVSGQNICWSWQARCEIDWAGWAQAIFSVAAILASSAIAFSVVHFQRQQSQDDARDAANVAMENAFVRLLAANCVVEDQESDFLLADINDTPLHLASDLLAGISLPALCAHDAQDAVIRMRENVLAAKNVLAQVPDRTLQKELLAKMVEQGWESLVRFQKAISIAHLDRVAAEASVKRELGAI